MDKIVPKGAPVRLVAFNLGNLPGGEKAIITKSETTLLALDAATRIVIPGGLISLVVYVGHPGGSSEKNLRRFKLLRLVFLSTIGSAVSSKC